MLLKAGRPEQFYLILRNAWDVGEQGFQNIYSDGVNTSQLQTTSQFFQPYFQDQGLSFIETCLMVEFSTKLVDDFLVNEDRTSMANSLELRVPFLDRDLVDLCLKMPGCFKVNNFQLKYLFNYTYIEKILNTKPSPRLRWHYFYLWLLIGFDIWHQLFIERTRHFEDPLSDFFHD